jgi:hypothetical protein
MPQDARSDTEATGHSTPLRAARKHCLSCCNGSSNEVRLCPAVSCALWSIRFGKRPTTEDRATVAAAGRVYPVERKLAGTTPLRMIRKRCIDCSGGRDPDVRACAFKDCALHPFRMATNPYLAPRSAEWQKAAAERLAALKRPSLPEFPRQNPIPTGAEVLEGELATREAAG